MPRTRRAAADLALPWADQAMCATDKHRMTFLALGDRPSPFMAAKARRVCLVCPVFDQCAHYAKTTAVSSGMWAGKVYGARDHWGAL